jgi:hypothetical protein
MLQEVLSGAHENMNSLENTLMARVSEFVSSMNDVTAATGEVSTRVETTIQDFGEITTRAATDLGQIAEQFEKHGRSLAQAIELVESSNRRSESTIGERRDQLDALISALDTRSEDLDQRLKRFSGLLDESLEAASTRARDIARVVSEASAEGGRAVAEQFERVREFSENERRRTTEAMHAVYQQSTAETTALYERTTSETQALYERTTSEARALYEQTTAETHAVFREANERFAELVEGMKLMTSDMQRELDATRAELHRGVFELPQETADSAAQMRRVIVDQIEALAELNRIVARHGRSLDAVEPMRRSGREEPTLAVVGGRVTNEPAPVRPSPAPAPRSENAVFGSLARRTESAPPPSPPPPAPQSANARGWLSDLLNRASREGDEPHDFARESTRGPEERTPRHTIESLDSLSVDIARMIDHDAAADLWDRYKRGERNVFTRRLYTLQGQKAFDEIRRKYRADREFRQTVDRYIDEFERLLEEVSRDDRGQLVARTYLTSETGKVYTMLAHAAGRFD